MITEPLQTGDYIFLVGSPLLARVVGECKVYDGWRGEDGLRCEVFNCTTNKRFQVSILRDITKLDKGVRKASEAEVVAERLLGRV